MEPSIMSRIQSAVGSLGQLARNGVTKSESSFLGVRDSIKESNSTIAVKNMSKNARVMGGKCLHKLCGHLDSKEGRGLEEVE
ncbi:MAG: hypothetical protein H0T62_07485 [Parachlamydiaceae bacterium]|nr:hypothetical protein [Parachlamydiaceae bacterium]